MVPLPYCPQSSLPIEAAIPTSSSKVRPLARVIFAGHADVGD